MLAWMRRGILGGTFDPPHLAHLVAGETAYRQLGLDVVHFIPAGAPWQKAERRVSDAAHRWEMTRRAVSGIPYFVADDREVRRDGWSYTVDTLETFDAADDLVLIVGADAAAGFRSWRAPDAIVARASLAVMPRAGVDPDDVSGAVGEHHVLDTPDLPISGTMLRQRVSEGGSIRFLVREGVHDYVIGAGLYRPLSDGAG